MTSLRSIKPNASGLSPERKPMHGKCFALKPEGIAVLKVYQQTHRNSMLLAESFWEAFRVSTNHTVAWKMPMTLAYKYGWLQSSILSSHVSIIISEHVCRLIESLFC